MYHETWNATRREVPQARGQQPSKITYKIYKSQDFWDFFKISKDLCIYFEIYISFLTDLKIIQRVSNQAKSSTSSDFFKISKIFKGFMEIFCS